MNERADTPLDCARALAAVLERQLACYREVLALCHEQVASIGAGDTEGLLRILAEKQKRMGAADALAREAVPLQRLCEGAALPATLRETVNGTLDTLRTVLAEIVAVENAGEAAMRQARQEDAGEAAARLQKGRMLNQAYGGTKRKRT